MQHGVIWHEMCQQPDGGYLERESLLKLWWSLALPEQSLRSMRVSLKLDLHEMFMQQGRMWLCLPETLLVGDMGSCGDLLRGMFHRDELPYSCSNISPQILSVNCFLAWQVLVLLPLTSICASHGEMHGGWQPPR